MTSNLFRPFLNNLADFNCAGVHSLADLSLPSFFYKLFGFVPGPPFIIGINPLMFHSFSKLLTRSRCLSIFSFFFNFLSIISWKGKFIFFFLILDMFFFFVFFVFFSGDSVILIAEKLSSLTNGLSAFLSGKRLSVVNLIIHRFFSHFHWSFWSVHIPFVCIVNF